MREGNGHAARFVETQAPEVYIESMAGTETYGTGGTISGGRHH
jgi:hypothetical protein